MERWCLIEEAPNYIISDQGRVQNRFTETFLKPQIVDAGYLRVSLSSGGPQFDRYIHFLVANAFVYGRFNGAEVNHKDGIKTNNIYWNLEWVTSAQNKQHASQLGLMGKRVKIVETGEIFQSLTYCARFIGGNPQNISHCLSGQRKSHCGYTFEWADMTN